MQFLVYVLISCLYGLIGNVSANEEFYILPMGQGNGQLVIYNADKPGQKVGVLYDLGSKSLQSHPKFINRDKWDLYFKKINSEHADRPKKILKIGDPIISEEVGEFSEDSQMSTEINATRQQIQG